MQLLLEAGAEKDARVVGVTALWIAALRGQRDAVYLLIQAGADCEKAVGRDGATPLHVAAQGGHLEVVCLLIEAGVDCNQGGTDPGTTPLYVAADRGHLEVVRLLVGAGADPNRSRADTRATPLYAAAHKGHLEVVRKDGEIYVAEDAVPPLRLARSERQLSLERRSARCAVWVAQYVVPEARGLGLDQKMRANRPGFDFLLLMVDGRSQHLKTQLEAHYESHGFVKIAEPNVMGPALWEVMVTSLFDAALLAPLAVALVSHEATAEGQAAELEPWSLRLDLATHGGLGTRGGLMG
eukprot:Skav230954  [mRNA]  locus=scaffold3010:159185:182780:- [translate_table: standard]